MQSIDSNVIHLKKVRSYADSNGFVNFFNITGQLKSRDLGNSRIELLLSSKNPDYSIEVEVDPSRVPNRFEVGNLVTCTGYVRGVQIEGGGWGLRFRAKEVHDVKIADLSGDALDDLVRRMQLPYETSGDESERLATPEYRRAKGRRRNGNYIGLSGFVENMKFYPGEVTLSGKRTADSVKMLLRQWDDVGKSVMVELNGREARETYTGIGALSMKGIPFVRFHGEAYVKIKDVEVQVPVMEDGVAKKDDDGNPVVETQIERRITPAIKAIASVEFGKPEHCRQPKEIKDPESGKTRMEYPYPWTSIYQERAQALQQRMQRRG
jgi:hypothetical protein